MNTTENRDEKLTWTALEYEERERTPDWFWALGIIVVTSSIASAIYENYFFAILLLLGGSLLGFFATKKPDTVSYELNDKGLKIRDRFYPYENIKSFYVQVDLKKEKNQKPILFIHTERMFMPIITVPIEEELAEDIHTVMTTQNIPEVEMKEHVSEKIMEVLGF